MYAKLNEPSAPSIPASAAMGSGFSSTPTMPPTLSILSPSVSEREEHAAYLRSKYGIPVLMASPDPQQEFLDEFKCSMENDI